MRNRLSESARIERLQKWYLSPYAAVLHEQIWDTLKLYLRRIPVQSFIPVGLPIASDKPMHVNVGKQISLVSKHPCLNVDDFTLQDNLPLQTDSQSCLVYYHLLDVLDNPYQLLREASRVLDDAGYLIVVGFNPWSAYGVTRLLRSPWDYFKHTVPWSLKAYSQSRLTSWLRVLEFVPECTESCGFVPPILGDQNALILKKTEPRFARFSRAGGMVNIILFRKNMAPVTPIRTRWKVTSVKIPKGIQPSAHSSAKDSAHKSTQSLDKPTTGPANE